MHGHGDDHVHAPANFGKAFAIGISLNTALVVAEAVYGYLGNSTALLADAGHNLSDVLGLVVAWGASIAARRAPSGRFTYGLRASTILAALANAMFLLVATGAIGWEAILRLREPEPVAGVTVMVVAGIGILINGFTAMLFARGRKDDINIEGAYLHMAADAAVSLGVVVSATRSRRIRTTAARWRRMTWCERTAASSRGRVARASDLAGPGSRVQRAPTSPDQPALALSQSNTTLPRIALEPARKGMT